MLFAPFLLCIASGSSFASLFNSFKKGYNKIIGIVKLKVSNFKTSSNASYSYSKPIRLSLNNENDSVRLLEIHNSIDGIYIDDNEQDHYKVFPIGISRMIYGYEGIDSFRYVYDKVMIRFNISEKERSNLDFYAEDFPEKLHSIITSKNKIYYKSMLSNCHLAKLLFKWMIYMNQKFVENDEKAEMISKSIKSFIIVSYNKDLRIPIEFTFKFMNGVFYHRFIDLIVSEIFENSHIFDSLASVIEYFYSKWGRKKVSCNDLQMKWFNGKSFDENILLKWSIILYDPIGEMRKCIPFDRRYRIYSQHWIESLFNFFSPTIITRNYLNNLRLNGPQDYAILRTEYITKSMIEFFLKTKRKFWIVSNEHFILLLGKLKEDGLLTMKFLKGIIGFREEIWESPEWNQEMFERFLKRCKFNCKPIGVEKYECDEYFALLN